MNSEDNLETPNFTSCPQKIEAEEKNKINLAAKKEREESTPETIHENKVKREEIERNTFYERLGNYIFNFFCNAPDSVYLDAIT